MAIKFKPNLKFLIFSKLSLIITWFLAALALLIIHQTVFLPKLAKAAPEMQFLSHMSLIAYGISIAALMLHFIDLIILLIRLPAYYELTKTHLVAVPHFKRRSEQVSLSKIVRLKIEQNFLARRFNYGIIRLITLKSDQTGFRWFDPTILRYVNIQEVLGQLPSELKPISLEPLSEPLVFHAKPGASRMLWTLFIWWILSLVFFDSHMFNGAREVVYAALFWFSVWFGMHLVKTIIWCTSKVSYSLSTTQGMAYQSSWWSCSIEIFSLSKVKTAVLRWNKELWILEDDTKVMWRQVPDKEEFKDALADLNIKLRPFLG